MKYALLIATLMVFTLGCEKAKPKVEPQLPAQAGQPSLEPATGPAPLKLGAEASQAVTFINEKFVASDCTLRDGSIWTICVRNEHLSIVGQKLVMAQDFEEHNLNGPTKYSHENQTAFLNDLNLDSLHLQDDSFEGATDRMRLDCKNTAQCVSSEESDVSGNGSPVHRSMSRIGIGDFSRKDGKEVESYLGRLLALQQGLAPQAIEREPTEEMAETFIGEHFGPTIQMGDGITAFNRSLKVQGDDLVETEDLTQYGRPGHLVVTVNIKDLDEDMMVADSRGIGLMCRVSSAGPPTNCFSADTGQLSSDHVLIGVSDRETFLKMLKRIIVLHQ